MNNYITISRRIFEHQFWGEDRVYSRFEAWVDILQSARFEDTKQLIGNRLVEIGRGQTAVSLRYLANRWKWSTKKVNSFLDCLVSDQMIAKETPKGTGQTVLTICNYDKYNYKYEYLKQEKKQKGNDEETARKQQGNKYNKENKENKEKKEKKEKTDAYASSKIDAPCGAAAAAALPTFEESPKNWRDDFDFYLHDVDAAYSALTEDGAFLADRQRFHPGIDIKLSIEKAVKDYWGTETGWKKKKASKSVSIDWKRTFVNALTLNSNQVKLQHAETAAAYVPLTAAQQRFSKYLEENAPLMLQMPLQPTDEEIDSLRNLGVDELRRIVDSIGNNRYLTKNRNSVYKTIMEIKEKNER